MFNKRVVSLLLVLVMLLAVFAGCTPKEQPAKDDAKTEEKKEDVKEDKKEEPKEDKKEDKKEEPTGDKKNVSVFYYNYGDTYISTVRNAFTELVKGDANVELTEYDGQNDQAKQNDQIDVAIQKGANVLVVNIVDFGAADIVIDKAKAAGIPVSYTHLDVYKRQLLVFISLLSFFDFLNGIMLIFMSFWAAALYIPVLIFKGVGRKNKIAFLPFILASYLLIVNYGDVILKLMRWI